MQYSARLDRFGNEIFAALNKKRRDLEAQGRKIYDLSVGTPDFKTPDHVVQALVDSCADTNLWKYSLHEESELLDAVSKYYVRRFGVEGIEPEEVALVTGTQEGMAHLALALVDEGDTVLVPDPCYPIFEGAVKIAGATPVYYSLNEENGFVPDLDAIPAEVADAAKYIVVSLPANPVGSIAPEGFYDHLIEWARKHDVLVVHDNAYSDIIFTDEPGTSFLAYDGAKEAGVEFFSLSKSFNVTGARLSFLVGRKDVVDALRKLRGQLDFGTFLPLQRVARACLEGPLEGVEEQRQAYKERRDALCESLEEIGWEKPSGHGTMFVWAKMPEGYTDSFEFVAEVMDKSGVVLTPGASFGPGGEGYVRFALVLPPDELRAAVRALRDGGFGTEE
jgi:LL-diaminopimelate aminotransferase